VSDCIAVYDYHVPPRAEASLKTPPTVHLAKLIINIVIILDDETEFERSYYVPIEDNYHILITMNDINALLHLSNTTGDQLMLLPTVPGAIYQDYNYKPGEAVPHISNVTDGFEPRTSHPS